MCLGLPPTRMTSGDCSASLPGSCGVVGVAAAFRNGSPPPARYSSYASVALYASSSLSPRNLAGARKYAISPSPSLGSLSVR